MTTPWTTLIDIGDFQGISQSKIARKLGVNQSSVSRKIAGIPALSSEYKTPICEILSVDNKFLDGLSDYPFLPGAFVKFRIRGLRARRRPLAWLKLLCQHARHLDVLLLLKEDNTHVAVACVKDDRESIFFVFVEIPLRMQGVSDLISTQPKDKVRFKAITYFDSTTLGFHRNAHDIEHYERNTVDFLIDDSMLDVLSDEEKDIIRDIRKKRPDLNKLKQMITDSSDR